MYSICKCIQFDRGAFLSVTGYLLGTCLQEFIVSLPSLFQLHDHVLDGWLKQDKMSHLMVWLQDLGLYSLLSVFHSLTFILNLDAAQRCCGVNNEQKT